MKIATLSGAVPLTKSYTLEGITPYPHLSNFTSTNHEVSTIKDLYVVIKAAAEQGHCLLKGTLNRDLVNESRAGSTDSTAVTEWACFDLDGTRWTTPEQFIHSLPAHFHNVSYVVQYSASYGIKSKTMGCHIFMLLSAPMKANILKLSLQTLNFNTPDLSSQITLTRSHVALHYPLDITCCQNDKLIYIALPRIDKAIKLLVQNPGVQLVLKSEPHLDITHLNYESAESLQTRSKELRNRLRNEAGYTPIKAKVKMLKGVEVQDKLGPIAITEGPRYDRGFVYFNLNGGDSWGYYHPENNFELILNFKGEPAYLTKEIAPEYYAECTAARQASAPANDGTTPFVFRDLHTASFWNGYWNESANELNIYPARTEKQLDHFMQHNNRTMGDFVPVMQLIFNPTSTLRLDLEEQLVNNYQPSDFYNEKLIPLHKCGPETWPTIDGIFRHTIGKEEGLQGAWRNWLAFIIQYREKAMTAWLWSGTQGTGKGFITNKILKRLIGERHVIMKHQRELKSQFNSYMKQAIICVIDELDITKMDDVSVIDSDLKNFITEPYISIRAMHQESVSIKNYTSWIFNSNMYQAMSLPSNDRRFNIGERQERPLIMTDEMKQAVEEELFYLFSYLDQIAVDEVMVRTPYRNEARAELMKLTETTADAISSSILKGDIEYLLQQLPDQNTMDAPSLHGAKACAYNSIMKEILKRLTDKTMRGYYRLSRDELFAIFDYTVGNMSPSPAKFTQYLKHHGILTKPTRINGLTRPAIEVTGGLLPEQAQILLDEYFPSKRTTGEARIESMDKARLKRQLETTANKALEAQKKRSVRTEHENKLGRK